MRPMTIPDLLDGAFNIVKRRPRDVLVLAVTFVVPVEVLSALLLRNALGSDLLGPFGASASSSSESDVFAGAAPALVALAIGAVSLALLAGALADLVGGWYDGEDITPGQAMRHTAVRAPALLAGVVVVHLFELVGLLGIAVGAYLVMAFLQLVSPVIVAEGMGPFRAVARSMQLTGSRFGTSLAVPALVGLIGALVGFGFQILPELSTVVVPDGWHWLARAVGQILAQLVVTPFTAGVAVLYHLDLRIRSEGLDIERRTRDLFGD